MDKEEIFANKVKELANEMGIDYFLAVTDDIIIASNNSNNEFINSFIKNYSKKKVNELTFMDLYRYTKTAKIDNKNGLHLLLNKDESLKNNYDAIYPYPRYYIKPILFNDNIGIEFYIQNEENEIIEPIVNFIYYTDKNNGWDEVTITKWIGNMPDYGSSFNIPASYNISEIDWNKISCKVNVGEILNNILTRFKDL